MPKKILILGGGQYHIRTIKAVKDLGYKIYCLDKSSSAPAFQYADYFAAIDIFDREEVLKYARKHTIDGIMPINDFGTRSAFYASQKLNLISPSLLTGICSNNKDIMRDVWNVEGLNQPRYMVFNPYATQINEIIERIGFPLIIKPTDTGGGGRGIMVVSSIEELKQAIEHAKPFAKHNRLLAEEFIKGVELTVDSFVCKGNVVPVAISDKVKADSRFRVATSLNFPADIEENIIDEVKKLAILATEAMGVQSGMTHLELIVTSSKQLKLVEIGIRGGGGHIFNTIIEVVTGINAPQELAKILCGEVPDLTIKHSQGCVYRFFNPEKRGIVQRIVYDEALLRESFVVDFGITIKPGDQYKGLIDSLHRIGYVVTKGKDRQEAIKFADLVESAVEFI